MRNKIFTIKWLSAIMIVLFLSIFPNLFALENRNSNEFIFYFSNLDSIKPFVFSHPTGNIKKEAPELDTRQFYPPDLLMQQFNKYYNKKNDCKYIQGKPNQNFGILGLIVIPLELLHSGYSYSTCFRELKNRPMAPNNKYWIDFIEEIDWKNAFKKLERETKKLNGDAVIEIVCGHGIPYYIDGIQNLSEGPTNLHFISYGPHMVREQIISSYVIIGLVVKWTE
ncbi:hypothetical protein KJ656_06995 [bacterium]|nr:hypothetical protein [bacterium]